MEPHVIASRLRSLRALPPRAIAGRVARAASRRWHAAREKRHDIAKGSFGREGPAGVLNVICGPIVREQLGPQNKWIEQIAALHRDHTFDLLGSGWVHQHYGMDCKGVDGTRFDPGPRPQFDPAGQWLKGRINDSNLTESQRIWQMIDPAYNPIDWQLDFKSGFRWREITWTGDIEFGVLDGVDVKVPWELSRMQHLLLFAWAHRLDSATQSGGTPWVGEFRNQLLDFIATNPPRFGVNWFCAMDVAIRAANWVVAYGLFRAHGAVFDEPFETALKQSLLEHGRHIVLHLEFYPEGRANHYFADIAGLLFIAAALPKTDETKSWLAFAIQELVGETAFQFNSDGSNFEGSTSYHRLSLEFATYATALATGLPDENIGGLTHPKATPFRTRPKRPLGTYIERPQAHHFRRLERAAAFTAHATRPDGNAVQIGDNDNGRFFKPHPVYTEKTMGNSPREKHRDHRGVVAAVHALTDNPALAPDTASAKLDAALVRALSRNRTMSGDREIDQAPRCSVGTAAVFSSLSKDTIMMTELVLPDCDLLKDLVLFGYPDFGLWIYRSDRLFLSVRCGPASSPQAGGSHAHNDQLAIELMIDNEPWIEDPGSYLYCPPVERRNQWRSVEAHAAPHWPGREPGRLDLGPFRLHDETRARCFYFGPLGFAGEHFGFGRPVRRIIAFTDDTISISDCGLPVTAKTGPVRCVGKLETQAHFRTSVPFSPGYGEIKPVGPA